MWNYRVGSTCPFRGILLARQESVVEPTKTGGGVNIRFEPSDAQALRHRRRVFSAVNLLPCLYLKSGEMPTCLDLSWSIDTLDARSV